MLERYSDRITAMLRAMGHRETVVVGVIFMTPERAGDANAPWVRIDEQDVAEARASWEGRDDPHGFGPSDERTVAVIAPLV